MAIIPDPGVYGEQTAYAADAYQRALGNIKTKQGQLNQTFGLTSDVGPNGEYSNTRADPNARYGSVQMLKYNQAQSLDQTRNQATQRGLGHMGLGAQDESDLRFRQGAESQQLGQQYIGGLQGLFGEGQDALNTYNTAKIQAQKDAINSAIQNNQYTPAAVGETAPATPSALAKQLAKTVMPGLKRPPKMPGPYKKILPKTAINRKLAPAKKVVQYG